MKKQDWIKDKVVVITGSSQGIGKELTLQFSMLGAKVVINGRNIQKLNEVADEFLKNEIIVKPIAADIIDNEQCERLINEVIREYGRIDVLINNGGLTMKEEIGKIETDIFSSVFLSNSMSAVNMTKAALPYLQETKGSVIFVSSIAGFHGLPSTSAYSMGKMSLTSLWQSLQIEYANSGVHFGICYLGFTENDPQKRMLTSDGKLIKVPGRPKLFVQSRSRVAHKIIQMVKRRKSKRTFSTLGKVSGFIFRHFPTISMLAIKKTNNRK